MRLPMHRMILTFLAVLFMSLANGAATPALAHTADFLMYRPYAIEKTCNHHHKRCKPRMIYAPGQHAGLAGVGSYWYQKPPGARKHGDFRLRSHKHKAHYHKAHAHKVHVKHKRRTHAGKGKPHHHHGCRKTGWGFDTITGSFAGGIPPRARCIRSYDWQ